MLSANIISYIIQQVIKKIMDFAYSPYKENRQKKQWLKTPKIPKINIPKSVKIWIGIILGIIAAILLVIYLSFGQLRFFANHFFGLTFFSKHYLVVLQNNYELRPGGGFVTGYGNVDFFMGIPGKISFKNSYDIDTTSYVTPPYPHEEMLKNEWYQGYTFRDANWNPDARDSSAELIKFYEQKFPDKDIDGVFVINFSMIENLIDELGGIEINGKELTKDNLFSELEFEVNNVDRHNVDALTNRKSILGDIASQLISKAKRHPFVLRDVLTKALEDKDFYIWLKNESLENKLIEKGWADVMVLPEKSDFLSINLANLGSKKADRYLQTDVNYYANLAKEVPEITTEITIRYPGFINTYSDNYKGYLRVYIPKSADVDNDPVDSVTSNEGNFKSIGTKIILPAGSKTTLTYVYTLPRTLFSGNEYKLRLVKQPGTEFLYRLVAEIPEGNIAQSDDFEVRENRALYIGIPETDMDFNLKRLPDSTPPYPIEQEFSDMSHINIIWNEPLDTSVATSADNYSVADMNTKDPTSDNVTVKEAELTQPNVVTLTLDGVTKQDIEAYSLILKNIKDSSGNSITPDPKTITVIQRFSNKPASQPVPVSGTFELPAQ